MSSYSPSSNLHNFTVTLHPEKIYRKKYKSTNLRPEGEVCGAITSYSPASLTIPIFLGLR